MKKQMVNVMAFEGKEVVNVGEMTPGELIDLLCSNVEVENTDRIERTLKTLTALYHTGVYEELMSGVVKSVERVLITTVGKVLIVDENDDVYRVFKEDSLNYENASTVPSIKGKVIGDDVNTYNETAEDDYEAFLLLTPGRVVA